MLIIVQSRETETSWSVPSCDWKETAADGHPELQEVYGDASLSETMCRDWFRRFKDCQFDVDDRPREGRLKTFEDVEL